MEYESDEVLGGKYEPPLPIRTLKRAKTASGRRKPKKNTRGRTCKACGDPWKNIVGYLAHRGEGAEAISRYLKAHFRPLKPPAASTIRSHLKHSEPITQMPPELALLEQEDNEDLPGKDPIDLREEYRETLGKINKTISRIEKEEEETGSIVVQKRYFLELKTKTANAIDELDRRLAQTNDGELAEAFNSIIKALNIARKEGGQSSILNAAVLEMIRLKEGEESANRILLISGGYPELPGETT